MTVDAGKDRMLRLDFAQSVLHKDLDVGLFDLSGRLVETLFAGRLSSLHLALPLNRAELRTGAYMLRISLDNFTLIKNNILFN